MLKKLFVFLAWLLLLLVLALACWVVGLYRSWPLWQSALLFAGILLAAWLFRALRSRWLAWRLRRSLARPVDRITAIDTTRVDNDFKAGTHALRRSRLSRFGAPLYVLPWFIALGPAGAAKTALLRRVAGADPIHADDGDDPVLHWWLMRDAVVLELAGNGRGDVASSGTAFWRRLLHWLVRTRRREPMNGLLMVFEAAWLRTTADPELVETGQALRQHVDELTRIYDARIPIYVIVTGCDALPGMREWIQALDPALQDQPLGYLNRRPEEGVAGFLATAFDSIVERLRDLRILGGMNRLPALDELGLPETVAPLALCLDKILRPAFQATPYAETPLLRGIFLTAQAQESKGAEPGSFTGGLFEALLPAQRHAWRPIERLRHWRRLLRHGAAVAWLILCVCAAVLLVHSERVADRQLTAVRLPKPVQPSDNLDEILPDMMAFSDAVQTLAARRDWTSRWLPFQYRVNATENSMRQGYANVFLRTVIRGHLDPLVKFSLPQVDKSGDATLLAAWAQTLVRRINLLDARLNREDLEALPGIGTELPVLWKSVRDPSPGPLQAQQVGGLYRNYLDWQPDVTRLATERDALRRILNHLNMPARPIQWIYSWVDLQGDLKPVRLSDYWDIDDDAGGPIVPATVTGRGLSAIAGFMAELGKASGESETWQQRTDAFREHLRRAGLDDWYRFATAFDRAPDRLPDASARRDVLSSFLTHVGPYHRFIDDFAAAGAQIAPDRQPEWIRQLIRIRALEETAADSSGSGVSAALREASDVNRMGANVLKHASTADALSQTLTGLREDHASLQLLDTYRQGVQATVGELLQGPGNAMQEAGRIWSYGRDPKVKAVKLIEANDALKALHERLARNDDPRSGIIWSLVGGPLQFTLDFAARSAACGLQQTWESKVAGAIQGTTDQDLIDTLLYGERGQVSEFLGGAIQQFVDHDNLRYVPREALGHVVELSGQFYAFANQAQLRQVGLLSEQRRSATAKDDIQALTQKNDVLKEKISSLRSTKGSVTLATVPALTNAQAESMPESVTLTLQCASQSLRLENLNFPNSAIFPWSADTCGDVVLDIRLRGISLTQRWSGSDGFISFLRDFGTGQHRYVPDDFPDQAEVLRQAKVSYILLSYRQTGQGPLLVAFAEAAKLESELAENEAKIAALEPAGDPGSPVPLAPVFPQKIIDFCMEPAAVPAPPPHAPAIAKEVPVPKHEAKKVRPRRDAPSHTHPLPARQPSTPRPGGQVLSPLSLYVVQVGVFKHPGNVRSALADAGYIAEELSITLDGQTHKLVQVPGYANRTQADDAARAIGELLHLTPRVVTSDAKRSQPSSSQSPPPKPQQGR